MSPLDVFKRLAHRKPAPAPHPRMAVSLEALKPLAPLPWQVDIDLAIDQAHLGNWGAVWEFLQRAAASCRDTEFGDAAAKLIPRAQSLDGTTWLAPTPEPKPQQPRWW